MTSGKRKIIIDTDAGLDDAEAILMALKSPDVEIVAITTSHGNTEEHNACRNVLRLLKMMDRTEIPVYRGCCKSVLNGEITGSYYHGQDGFGDVPDPEAPDLALAQSEHAALAMIRLIKQYPGEITLLALAPATNLVLALRLDPDISQKLKACYLMGGNYEGPGNITSCAEFNFYADPEAAAVVLQELQCPLYLICWELCLTNTMSMSWYDKFVNKPTKIASFLKKIEEKMIKEYYKDYDHYMTADTLVMAIFLAHDVIVKESRLVSCTVELSGRHCRGQTVVLREKDKQGKPRIHLIREIDHELYEEMLYKCTD